MSSFQDEPSGNRSQSNQIKSTTCLAAFSYRRLVYVLLVFWLAAFVENIHLQENMKNTYFWLRLEKSSLIKTSLCLHLLWVGLEKSSLVNTSLCLLLLWVGLQRPGCQH